MDIYKLISELVMNSVYLGNFLLFVLISFHIFKRLVKLEGEKEENLVSGVLILSLSIAVSSLYSGESYGLVKDLLYIWFYSALSFILLIVGHLITDFIIFHKVKNIEEIQKGNFAILIVEVAHFIAIGIVINSLMNNYFSPDINQLKLLLSIVVIFLFIQFLLVLSILIYKEILILLKKINIIELVYKNNVSAGIFLFSNYIVISFLLASAFSPEKDIITTIIYSFIYFIFSTFIIILFKFVVDFILIPDDNLENIIKDDKYMKAIFIELITISMIFIYHFLSS
ncbi:MAG: hypothetical protein DSY59_01885 [Persephonella sp.]|nr:MAG: hypothetical protein DSY60_00045 [Persephonella sp.]RUM61171.1 MAG: hypothetical protein DSY59_01885 [Persephonella sp.]